MSPTRRGAYYSMPARSKPRESQCATQASGVIVAESMREPVKRRALGSSAAQMLASCQPALSKGVAASKGVAGGNATVGTTGVAVVVNKTRACKRMNGACQSAGRC